VNVLFPFFSLFAYFHICAHTSCLLAGSLCGAADRSFSFLAILLTLVLLKLFSPVNDLITKANFLSVGLPACGNWSQPWSWDCSYSGCTSTAWLQ